MDPIVIANCGLPVTTIALSNTTRTVIGSPRSYVESRVGVVVKYTSLTMGAFPRVPSTLWAASLAIAFAPRPKPAAVLPSRASAIAPPFSARALAPMPMPFESESAAITV